LNTVLITGAASGIGRATAEHLAATMHVVLADIDSERAEAAADAIAHSGGTASAIGVNVADAQSVAAMMSWIDAQIGPVHALFNNAGIDRHQPVEDIAEDDWDRTLNVHVKGTFLCTRAVLPQMIARQEGAIVNMGSDYSVKGMKNGAAYAAAKTAVYSLTKSLAAEFASDGIRVNAVGPGPIETLLLRDGRSPEEWDTWKSARSKLVPMGRLGQPSEVASLVDFLLSDRSSYLTGQIIHPNGGQISW
jgi:NAD(P)-dependent dehydrogenase (short-subunit alcohol dehydrogenase family)